MDTSSRFSLGLLGTGRIGTMHAGILANHAGLGRLVVADADAERAQSTAARFGCEAAEVAQVLDPANPLALDGLIIATSTVTHADLLVAAARTGLPTFCEKPLALDLAEALRAQSALEAAGLPHHIGFHRRFDHGYRRARDLLRAGELGELHRFHALTCDQFPPSPEFVAGSGGIFRDCNVHDFDILRWLTGREVVEVYATGIARGHDVYAAHQDFSEAVAVLTLDDGTIGTVQASRYNGQGYEVRLDLMGTAGSANVGLDAKVPLRSVEAGTGFPTEAPWTDFIERFLPCYEREIDDFLTGPMLGSAGACTAADAVAALRIADACTRSAHENRPVRLDEIG
ncbi:MAG: Gfo/Idh/MocA family oxidoreductase [Arachnia sp.]